MTDHLSNLFTALGASPEGEGFCDLLVAPHLKIERIVSFGHATPESEWLAQDRGEWVLLLSGDAALRFEGEPAPRVLKPGDHMTIPAHSRHRVEWTAPDEPTVWLAVHYDP